MLNWMEELFCEWRLLFYCMEKEKTTREAKRKKCANAKQKHWNPIDMSITMWSFYCCRWIFFCLLFLFSFFFFFFSLPQVVKRCIVKLMIVRWKVESRRETELKKQNSREFGQILINCIECEWKKSSKRFLFSKKMVFECFLIWNLFRSNDCTLYIVIHCAYDFAWRRSIVQTNCSTIIIRMQKLWKSEEKKRYEPNTKTSQHLFTCRDFDKMLITYVHIWRCSISEGKIPYEKNERKISTPSRKVWLCCISANRKSANTRYQNWKRWKWRQKSGQSWFELIDCMDACEC